MSRSQMPQNNARNSLNIRKNARATTGQLEPVFARPAVGSDSPDNQRTLGKKVVYTDTLQYEYRSFIFEMSPDQVTEIPANLVSQSLLGKGTRRRYLLVQNNSLNANIFLSFGNGETTGLSDYIVIPVGTSLELTNAPNNDVAIYAQDLSLVIPQPPAIVSVLVGSLAE